MSNKKYFTEKERKDANRKRLQKWTKNNPEKAAKHWKKYRDKNKDLINSRRRKDRKENPKKYSDYILDYRQSTVRRFLAKKLSNIRGRWSEKGDRGKEFDITIDFLEKIYNKQDGKCAITGYDMKIEFRSPYSVSVDRINSAKGYIKTNVQLVCLSINFAKNDFSNKEIIKFWTKRPVMD